MAAAATRTNGKPRLRAAKSETRLDLPISSEPPATAAATAAPLFAGWIVTSRPDCAKAPLCTPHSAATTSASGAVAMRMRVSVCAPTSDGMPASAVELRALRNAERCMG